MSRGVEVRELFLNEPISGLKSNSIYELMKNQDTKNMTVGYGIPAVMRRLISGKKHYDDIVYTIWDKYALELLQVNEYVHGHYAVLGNGQGIYLVTEIGLKFWQEFLDDRMNNLDSKLNNLNGENNASS